MGGFALALGPTAAAIALVVVGITMLVVGIKDMIENGPNLTNILLVMTGVIATIIGVVWAFNSALLANPITWVVAAIVALIAIIALCIVYWDDIKAAVEKCWEAIVKAFGNVANWFKERFDDAVAWIKNAWDDVTDFFAGIWEGIKKVFSGIGTWFKLKFFDAWNGIKKVFSGVGDFFSGIWKKIKNIFKKVGSTIGDAVSGAFKSAINWVLEKVIGIVNGFLKNINAAIGLINKIPGVNIKKIELLEVPQLAKGGIVNNPGRGVLATVGEAGAEAVLPLERNTGWMDILAEKINGGERNIVVQVILNGKKIQQEIISLNKKRDFATNGAN